MMVMLVVMIIMMGLVMGFVVGVMGFAFVVNVGNIATIAMGIGYVLDSLDAAIWQVNLVITRHHLAVRFFVLAEICSVVVIVDIVMEVVGLGMMVVVVVIAMMVMVMVVVMIVMMFCHHTKQDCSHHNCQKC